jgi:hypothetical protein
MVRRGSTVRVRQRALQKPRITALLFRINLQFRELGVGMEPVMEPSGRKRPPEGCQNDVHSGCGSVVLVDEAAEPIAAVDMAVAR